MADMYGTVVSNDFRVKDIEAFKTWFDAYRFGDNIQVFENKLSEAEDGSIEVSFGGDEQYPNAYPMVAIYDDKGFIEDIVEAEEDVFSKELRAHLVAGEIFHVMSVGAEKLRYAGCSELIIAEDDPRSFFRTYFSDDDNDMLRERMKDGRTLVEDNGAVKK